MEFQGVNIGLDTIQVIDDTLSKLKRCGGAINDDDLWPGAFADGCVQSNKKQKQTSLHSFGELQMSLQNAMVELKRVEAVENALFMLAWSCNRRLKALKTKLRPSFLSFGIQALPDEILAEIFKLCVDGYTGADEYDAVHPEMTLSQVSARFRSVALGIPSLWVKISSRMSKASLRQHLDCSKGAPLTVVISEHGWSERLHQFIKLVTPHALRWKCFEFEHIPGDANTTNFPEKLTKHFSDLHLPNLDSFKLYARDSYDARDFDIDLFDFHGSWCMQNVHHVVTLDVLLDETLDSLEKIKSFDLSHTMATLDLESLLSLLVTMSSLQKVCLHIFGSVPDDAPMDIIPVMSTLPTITDLTFETDCLWATSFIFHHAAFSMPSLKKFRLHINDDLEEIGIMKWLLEIRGQLFATVKELDLSFTASRQGRLDLSWLLNSCPRLEKLSLEVPDIYASYLFLKVRNMPPLRSLSIQLRSTLQPFVPRDVTRALKSNGRWNDFEYFQFKNDRMMSKQQAERFTEGKIKWYE